MTARLRSLPCSVGLDVGGTKTLGVLVDSTDAVIASVRLLTDTAKPHGVVRTMHQVIDRLLGDAGVHEHELSSIGVGIPGRVDHVHGEVSFALNLGIGKRALNVATAISERYHVDVHVENDVNAAALGAYFLLRDPAVADISYLSLGTGLAAGLVLGGKLRRGATGVAGEIGAPLIDGVRSSLRALCRQSPLLDSLDVAGRTVPVVSTVPAGAIGAALLGRLSS